MPAKSIRMPLVLQTGRATSAFLKALRAMASEDAVLPRGSSLAPSEAGATISFSKRSFALVRGGLVLTGLPPVRAVRASPASEYSTEQLIARVSETHVTFELVARKRKVIRAASGAKPKAKGQRIHGEAAIFIVAGVRPRTVSGGLHSLPKK